MFYSKSTNGFYDAVIHGENIPADAVEITADEHAALLEGQSQGKLIQADTNGKPVLTDQPLPTPEQILVQQLAEAQAYLASTDFYYPRFLETGEPVPEDVVQKRIEAREFIRANSEQT